jgi:hypothetical protein
MSDTWGKGAKNNTIGWGSAACTTTNDWGKSQKDSSVAASWSGDTDISGCSGTALSITYSSSAFCEDASDPTPTVTDNVGAGTFSSTAGLVFVSTTTGEVDISASTSGATYVITYTDTDAATATFSLTINDLDNASFAYSQSSYSPTDADPTPTITGLAGGTFSAGSGLVFVDSGSNTGSSTGEINLSASTVASYTITYTTAGTCPNTSTQSVEIEALAQIDNLYSMQFDSAASNFIDLGQDVLFNSTQGFSVSAWVYLDSYSTTFPTILRVKTDQSTGFILSLSNQTNYSGVIFGSSSNFLQARTTGDISGDFIGVWKHVCLTFDGVNRTALSSYKIYIDGSPVGLVNSGAFGAMSNNINAIGFSQNSSNYWNGKIDETSLFNVALTEPEALSIYNATETGKTADLNDLTTPPVKWYRMGD